MKTKAWTLYGAGAAVVTVLYFAASGPLAKLVLWCPLGFSSAAAVLAGTRLHRPAERVHVVARGRRVGQLRHR